MDIPISHLIGTVALIFLTLSASFSFSMIASQIEANMLKQQLREIGEYISLNLIEVITLVNFADYLNNFTMLKVLKLPLDVGGGAYVIKLISETGQGYYVYLYLLARQEVVASSPIPLNTTGTQVMLVADPDNGGTLLVRDGGRVKYSGIVYGGRENIVVWGWRKDNETTLAGIGVWRGD